MAEYSLSYVLTTFNKFEYIKITLPLILENIQEGEELVITDGGSTDGTAEYLKDLFERGQVNQLISEKDWGEAHGFNKGILLAKGRLIKLISDDDLFFPVAVRKSKEMMLKDPSIDIVFSSGLDYDVLGGSGKVTKYYEEDKANYENWLKKGTAFYACALGILFKRDSIPLMGLLSTNNVRVDMEYLLRITYNKKIIMRFCDCYSYVRFCNESSNSNKYDQRIGAEGFYLSNYYNSMMREDYDQGLFKYLLKLNWRWLLLFISRSRSRAPAKSLSPAGIPADDLPGIFTKALEILRKENEILENTFFATRP